ncbi:MAG TPA: cytochrome c oxidase subunit II [Deinococcales bacterium]|nr:cytochrome c oxidase subunit II [Deinococcales bacterium]
MKDSRGWVRWGRMVSGAVGLGLALAGCGGQQSALNPAGPEAARTALWWWIMFALAMIVLAVVITLVLVGLMRRRDPGETGRDGRWVGVVLIGGAAVPAVVLAVLMSVNVATEHASAAASGPPVMTIQVIGHRWWWEVVYPKQGFSTANEIHIPVGQPVRLLLNSDDVIHSFWVPELAGKTDMIPGQTNEMLLQANRAGVYRGQCAELCGEEHAKMAFIVQAQAPGSFNTWLQAQAQEAPVPTTDEERQGQQVFLSSACVYCHAVRGTNASSRFGPDLTHLMSRSTLGAGTIPNTLANLAGWVVDSQSIKPGNKMPPMYMDSKQLHALLQYLKLLQ